MATTVANRLPAAPRKTVEPTVEPHLKNFEVEESRRAFGRVIERACEIAGLTPQEIQHAFRLADQTQISRWFTGKETPQVARLLRLKKFRPAFMVALAESDNDENSSESRVRVRTVVEISRTA